MGRRTWIAFLVATGLLTGVARAEAPAAGVVVEGQVGKTLDRYLENAEVFGFSGTALVARGGKLVLCKGYGLADRAKGTRNGPDTLFEIASATKPITACAVLRLEELGKLSVDDPIDKHLPGVPKDKRKITVRHLLSHTSGMPRTAAAGRGSDLETAVRGYLSAPPARSPGSEFEYWNGGYALLAGIVERASGRSYVEFCREEVFRRAGLERTGFTGDRDLPAESEATGYDADFAVRTATGHPYGDYGYQYRGMGGVVTSARDLWRFVQALEDGKVVSVKTLRRMESPVSENYGLGWGMATTARKTKRIGHGGDVRGFHAQIQRFPDEGATVIVLSNVDGIPLWTVAWNVEALLFGQPPPNPMPPQPVPLPDARRSELPGTYRWKEGEEVLVATQGAGVRLEARGGNVGNVLAGGRVADFRADVTSATEIVEAVRKGDAALVASRLLSGIPQSWPETLIQRIWPAHLAKWGNLRGVRTLGAQALAPGRTEVLLGLSHEHGEACVRVVLQRGKLNIFDLEAGCSAASRVYVPVSEEEFASFAWQDPQPPRVRFERAKGGGAAALIVASARDDVRMPRVP